MIRVELPAHLRTLAGVSGEVALDLAPDGPAPVTLGEALDALEASYPVLRGAIRDHGTGRRRAFVRFFACKEDLSARVTGLPAARAGAGRPRAAARRRRDRRRLKLGQRPARSAGGPPIGWAGRRCCKDGDMARQITFTVNGTIASVPESAPLLSALRDELGLTGAKPGCGEGACGACTVLLDGEPVRSCQRTAGSVAGRTITTIEGLAAGRGAGLHPVQQAFALECAAQCGYCTPGMVLTSAALLAGDQRPDDAAIDAALASQICRCGTLPADPPRRAPGRGPGQRSGRPAQRRCGRPGQRAPDRGPTPTAGDRRCPGRRSCGRVGPGT